MISAVMQSMDPALEEASQVMGASRRRTMWRITLPLVTPGVLGAAIFVFAEMLGSFAVPLVLGTPARFYVITTAIYHFISQYPPRIPLAAAMGVSLFAVMFAMLWLYRWLTSRTSFVTVTGKAFPKTECGSRDTECIRLVVAELKRLYPEQLKRFCFTREMRAARDTLSFGDADPGGTRPTQTGMTFTKAAPLAIACASDKK